MKHQWGFPWITVVTFSITLLHAQAPPLVSPAAIIQEAKLTAPDVLPEDGFGGTVALSADTALIGANSHDSKRGAAYVFVRTGSTWSQQAKLLAPDGIANDQFGYSVALSGNTAVIGASGDDSARGAAYVFVRIGSTWSQQAKLLAPDGVAGEVFGYTVALRGDMALIGAPGDDGWGAAYVFVRSGTTWAQQKKLVSFTSAGFFFGGSVALSGDTALIGDDSFNNFRGAAYVFVRNGSTWRLQARLVAPGGVENDHFGWSAALLGDIALIGSYSSFANPAAFIRFGSTWTYANCCRHPPEQVGYFGTSVALNLRAAIIGAVGAGYVLPRGATTYTKLLPSDGPNGAFGYSVALSRDTVVVGAPGSGAYVFRAMP